MNVPLPQPPQATLTSWDLTLERNGHGLSSINQNGCVCGGASHVGYSIRVYQQTLADIILYIIDIILYVYDPLLNVQYCYLTQLCANSATQWPSFFFTFICTNTTWLFSQFVSIVHVLQCSCCFLLRVLQESTFLLLDSWVQAESGFKSSHSNFCWTRTRTHTFWTQTLTLALLIRTRCWTHESELTPTLSQTIWIWK